MTAPSQGQGPNPYETFARDFFTTLGAEWRPEPGGRVAVRLSDELALHYGRDALNLTFTPHDDGGEYVAYGSRAFDEMLGYLATRGRLTALALPAQGEATCSLRLTNGTARLVGELSAPRRFYVLHYLLSFLSDERVERLFHVVLDDGGRLLDAPPLDLAALPAPTPGVPWEGPTSLPVAVEATADAAALTEADRHATPLETEILTRLRKAAERLSAYYEEQIREVPLRRRRGQSEDEALDVALDERRALRSELERKLGEEIARHQLRVQVRRISQALVSIPGCERAFVLETPHAQRQVSLWENRHDGTVEGFACERCGAAGTVVGLCGERHVVCADCLGGCQACGRACCLAELSACDHTGALTCARCLETAACGHRVGRSLLAACACCGQVCCPACVGACPGCAPGRVVALAHAEPCTVCAAPTCGAHRAPCAWCGGANCEAHHPRCAGCGEAGCTSHFEPCRCCELSYCARCRDGEGMGGGEGGVCRACAAVAQGLPAPNAWSEAARRVPVAAALTRWLAIENEDYRYLLGKGLLSDVLVVLDAANGVVTVRESGVWRKWFGPWP